MVGAQEVRLVGRGRRKWTGYDVPDFPVDKRAGLPRRPTTREGMDAIAGADPFIMMADGKRWLYSPAGLLDGPFPTHYEPLESPLAQRALPGDRRNPAALRWTRPDNPYAVPATRATRSWPRRSASPSTTPRAAMSRNLPWLAELQPEMFAEIDPILAPSAGSRTAAG